MATNTADLRSKLMSLFDDIRHGRIDARKASTANGVARTMLTSAKLELDAARLVYLMGGKRAGQPMKVVPFTLTHGGKK